MEGITQIAKMDQCGTFSSLRKCKITSANLQKRRRMTKKSQNNQAVYIDFVLRVIVY